MKAMILAAGLGTRLRPLTDHRPKALVEIGGHTLLEITLSRLRAAGVRQVIINVHYLADMVADYLRAHGHFGMQLEVSREEVLLDTGGGLKKAAYFFLENPPGSEEPFILHNVDVLSTIDLLRMVEFHRQNRALVTLAVQKRAAARYLLFDEHLQLCGWGPGRDQILGSVGSGPLVQALAFTGIHVISPRFLTMMSEEGVFSIISPYLRLAAAGERIVGFRADGYYWRDLGRPADVQQAALDLQQNVL